MEPVFTLQYGEYAVAEILSRKIKGASVFIPASAQEKGIDMLLYKYTETGSKVVTVQVKMSRSYNDVKKGYDHYLWFNRFVPQKNADLFVFVGIYLNYETGFNAKAADLKSGKQWDEIFIVMTYGEIAEFMENVRLKKNPEKYDGKFGFGFNTKEQIFLTRGFPEITDFSDKLLPNRIEMIKSMLE